MAGWPGDAGWETIVHHVKERSMPAHIGFLSLMKLPLDFLYQLGPTKGSKKMRSMGFVSPAVIYRAKKGATEKRNFLAWQYNIYRQRMEWYDPYYQKKKGDNDFGGQVRYPPVDKTEWDNYLKAGTSFDKAVEAAIAAGWKITLVGEKSNLQLKRIEAKRTEGAPSITLWTAVRGANGEIFD
jgi:hypothetical protein